MLTPNATYAGYRNRVTQIVVPFTDVGTLDTHPEAWTDGKDPADPGWKAVDLVVEPSGVTAGGVSRSYHRVNAPARCSSIS